MFIQQGTKRKRVPTSEEREFKAAQMRLHSEELGLTPCEEEVETCTKVMPALIYEESEDEPKPTPCGCRACIDDLFYDSCESDMSISCDAAR